MTNTGSTPATMLAAADIASGKMIWTQTIWRGTEVVGPNALAMNSDGSALFVYTSAPTGAVFVNPAFGTTIAPVGANITGCNFFSGKYAVCENSGGALVVLDTRFMPPAVAWQERAQPLLIAADANQLIAITGDSPFSLSLDGFDLATGALAWALPCPWVGSGAATVAYDNAGTLLAAWMGYDAAQHYSAIVATYALCNGTAAPATNISLSMFAAPDAIQGLALDSSGRAAFLIAGNSTGTFLVALAVTPTSLAVAGIPLSWQSYVVAIQAIPGPEDGKMIIGAPVQRIALYRRIRRLKRLILSSFNHRPWSSGRR